MPDDEKGLSVPLHLDDDRLESGDDVEVALTTRVAIGELVR